jgi:hypothetical protein
VEVCAKHLRDAPEAPSAVVGDTIDPAFEALILRCLAKPPEDRPRDGAVLAAAFEGLDLQGWTLDDARVWWRDLAGKRDGAVETRPTPTQLAVDVEGRR